MKKIISLIAVMAIAAASMTVAPVHAETSPVSDVTSEVQPRYTYATSASSELTKSGSTAYCSSSATGTSSIVKIFATQYFEKKGLFGWSTVESVTKISYTNSISVNTSKTDLSSGTYRVRTEFRIYVDGNSETFEVTSSSVKF